MPPVLHRQAEAGRHRGPGGALRAPLRPARRQVLTGPVADERRRALSARKLGALVAGSAEPWPHGATLVEGGTGRAWALVDDADPAGLAAALVWAERHGHTDLQVVVDDTGGTDAVRPASVVVANRATTLARPPTVWRVDGRALVPVAAVPPVAADGPSPWPEGAAELTAHGVDPVVEHGVLRGDVLGLEVARAAQDAAGGWVLDVGVGSHDREARAEMRAGQSTGAALDDLRHHVLARRRPGAARHPANTLARERWLRSLLVVEPGRVGAATLAPVAPAAPRTDLRRPSPAPALGADPDGTPVVVVASTGADLDLVPAAAEVRRRVAPDARLRLVVPEGDDLPVTGRLAGMLARPAELVTVPRHWADWTPGPGGGARPGR